MALNFREHKDLNGTSVGNLASSISLQIAVGYRGYGLPVADLISEGNIGLMKAVKFDPDRGFRLSTYAMWWIKRQLQNMS